MGTAYTPACKQCPYYYKTKESKNSFKSRFALFSERPHCTLDYCKRQEKMNRKRKSK